MNALAKESLSMRVAKHCLTGILLIVIAMVALGLLSAFPFVLQMVYHLFCGWVLHGWKALPQWVGKWQEAVLPLGCLLMAAVILHRFVRRWVLGKFPDRIWRIRHTAGVLSLLLLGSAAAIAASGVVHQLFWLGSGKMTESNRRVELTMTVSNCRQLMIAILEFYDETGRYPHTLQELGVPPELIWVNMGDGRAREPFVFLRPGSTEIAQSNEPLLVSPLLVNVGKVVVGYGDSSVRSESSKNLRMILAQDETKESEVGR